MMERIEQQMQDEGMEEASLEAYNLTHDHLQRIVEIINKRKNPLDTLNLRNNNIDDKGAQILGAIKNLRYLDVGVNHISDEGINYLIENTPFESLDLSTNELTDRAVERLLSSSKLTWVDVTENRGISQENKVKLATQMQQNKLRAQRSVVVSGSEPKMIHLQPKEQGITGSISALSKTRSPLHTAASKASEISLLEEKYKLESQIEELRLKIHEAKPEQVKSIIFQWVVANFSPTELLEVILQKAEPEELEQLAQLINKNLSLHKT